MSSKQSLTDAGVGRALFTTKFRLSLQAATMCFSFGALPAFVIPLVLWFFLTSPFDVDLVKFGVVSRIVPEASLHRWRFREDLVNESVLTVRRLDGSTAQWMTAGQAREVLRGRNGPSDLFQAVLLFSVFAGVLGYFATWWFLRNLGSGSQENQRLRGAKEVVTQSELDKRIRGEGGGAYKLVDVALPMSAPTGGILVEGAQGSGKSLAIHDLMLQVFAKRRKCIIYDESGEYFRAYFRPGKDVFFNPALTGTVGWSLFNELRYTYDADSLGQAFLPQEAMQSSGSGGFFKDAARALFSAILLRLSQAGATNTRDIAAAILSMPAEEMSHLIRDTVAHSSVGGDSKQQRQGVISSIAVYLSGIAAVPAGDWTFRRFLEVDDDSRLFIVNTEDTKAMFAPLYRLMLTVAFGAIASKQELVKEDRYWFFLDEEHTLGDIRLDERLATLRKFGVCAVAGIQSESQLITSMGKDRADTVTNCFNTALMLRANEPSMQERIANRLGKLEMDTVARNQALAVTEWRDGAALNKTEHEKWLVMPSEIGSLGTCKGWLKVLGEHPAAKVDYSNWLPKRQGGRARVDRFQPIQPMPDRNAGFMISRAVTEDALASVRAEFEKHQAGAVSATSAPSDGVPKAAPVVTIPTRTVPPRGGTLGFAGPRPGSGGGRLLVEESGPTKAAVEGVAAAGAGEAEASKRERQAIQTNLQTSAGQTLDNDHISQERSI